MATVVGGTGELSLGVMLMAFAGGLALFLHGMDGVTAGLRGLAGTSLRRALARLSANRFAGVATGVLATATIQSSTVTMVLVIGFLASGLLTLTQSVGVIIGANVGTTITAQIIAFDVIRYALAMIAVGVVMQFAGRREPVRQFGRALGGLGIVFLGMGVMQDAMAPLRTYEPFLDLMAVERGPLLGVALGAAATGVIQSSSATIGIVVVMASQGLIPLETGIAIALGASLGTAITTMIATIGRPPVALRAGLIHIVFNVVGVGVMLLLLDPLADAAVWLSPSAEGLAGAERAAAETPRQIANAYTLAKAGMLLGFVGFTGQLARLAERLVPERPGERAAEPAYLDEDVLNAPSVALELARKETCRLGERVLEQIDRVVPAVLEGSPGQLRDLAERDEDVDRLHDAILAYLRRIDDDPLSSAEGEQITRLINVASSLELTGDIVERDLVRIGLRRIEEGVPLSDATRRVVTDFHATVRGLYADALTAFATDDPALAQQVLEAKPEVDAMLERAARHHAERLGADAPQRVAAYARGTETLEHLRRLYTFARRISRAVPER